MIEQIKVIVFLIIIFVLIVFLSSPTLKQLEIERMCGQMTIELSSIIEKWNMKVKEDLSLQGSGSKGKLRLGRNPQTPKLVMESLKLPSIVPSDSSTYTVNSSIIYLLIWDGEGDKPYDMATIRLACIHELAHIATRDTEHNDGFYKIEKELRRIALDLGLVKKSDKVNSEYPCRT